MRQCIDVRDRGPVGPTAIGPGAEGEAPVTAFAYYCGGESRVNGVGGDRATTVKKHARGVE
jgi:hypothetical protein